MAGILTSHAQSLLSTHLPQHHQLPLSAQHWAVAAARHLAGVGLKAALPACRRAHSPRPGRPGTGQAAGAVQTQMMSPQAAKYAAGVPLALAYSHDSLSPSPLPAHPQKRHPNVAGCPAMEGCTIAFVGLSDIVDVVMEVGPHPNFKVLICTQTA